MASEIVTLTDAAVEHVEEVLERFRARALRLSVTRSGCSGYGYDLSLVDGPHAGDEVVRVGAGGAEIHVDRNSVLLVLGTTIDWAEDALSRRFVFSNPNEVGRCGCGESFRVAERCATA